MTAHVSGIRRSMFFARFRSLSMGTYMTNHDPADKSNHNNNGCSVFCTYDGRELVGAKADATENKHLVEIS